MSQYWYLTLTPPTDRPGSIDSQPVIDFLLGLPELQRSGAMSFQAAPGQPWLDMALAKTHADSGGYAVYDAFVPQIDILELVCSEADQAQWYDDLACRIAQRLDWIAVEEQEARRLWPPAPSMSETR